jgi:serine/threonine protein kinase
MGEVYLAEDTTLGRKVAIKFMSPKLEMDERARKRLIQEARSAALIDHPNICAIHEVGQDQDRAFIVMQYVQGQTLASRIHGDPLETGELLAIAVQIADALSEAHSHGIIHRDIKPQNIMITARGQPKLMDFGLAKRIVQRSPAESQDNTESLLTAPGSMLGTVPYMSPEQMRGEELDARSDIFSFGAVLY